MRHLETALKAMLASMILSEAISLGSLTSTRGKLTTQNTSTPLSAPTILVALLEPATLALEVIAIALAVYGVKELRSKQSRLIVAAATLFTVWVALNFAVFLPLSLTAMKQGSVELARLALTIKAAAAILQYAVPFLLAYPAARDSKARIALFLALALTIVGGLGTTATPIPTVKLKPISTQSGVIYALTYEVDYVQWPYPAYLALSHLGGILYILAYASIMLRNASKITGQTTEK